MNSGLVLGGVVVAVVIALVAFFVGRQSVFRSLEYRRNQRSLTYYNETFLRRQGGTLLYGDGKTPYNYCLWSMDGGKTWYEVDETEDKFRIIREADPKLISTLKSLDDLVQYAQKHGPLTLTGDRAGEDLLFLQGSGFTVKVGDQEVSSPDQLPAPVR